MASSAVSVVSTSRSYFSRIRDKNMRADFESSTINARLPLMPAPDDKSLKTGRVYRRTSGRQAPRVTGAKIRVSPDYDAESVNAGWEVSQRRARTSGATGESDRYSP